MFGAARAVCQDVGNAENGRCVQRDGRRSRRAGSDLKEDGRGNATSRRRKAEERIQDAPVSEVRVSAEIRPAAQTDLAPRRQRDDHPVDAETRQPTAEQRGGYHQTADHGS